jgi:hypothetical protein
MSAGQKLDSGQVPPEHAAAFAAKAAYGKISAEENSRRYRAAKARDVAIARVIGEPDAEPSVLDRYVDHQQALQEHESDKLNRLQVMLFAQRTRTKFLGLGLADRKIFLDVLTADDNGSMSQMFALQAEMDNEKFTDDDVKLDKVARKAKTMDKVHKKCNQQLAKHERRKNLLDPANHPAALATPALALTKGDSGK